MLGTEVSPKGARSVTNVFLTLVGAAAVVLGGAFARSSSSARVHSLLQNLVHSAAEATDVACPAEVRALEQSWLQARFGEAQDSSKRQALLAASDEALESVAVRLFAGFRAGRPLFPLSCLQEGGFRQRFVEHVNAAFFEGNVRVLEEEGGPEARAFAAEVRSRFGTVFLPGFQIFSEWTPRNTTLPAGFDRSAGGVFVRLSQLNHALFTTYFVHEVAHALDARLTAASRLSAGAVSVALALVDPEAVQKNRAPLAQAFAWVDMERAYLAEVRAWHTTLGVLSSLSDSALPRRSLWFLESPFGGLAALTREQIHTALFPRFTLNSTGLYENPVARAGLEAARSELEAVGSSRWLAVERLSQEAFEKVEAHIASSGL